MTLLNEVGLESQFANASRRGLFGSEQTRYTVVLTLEPVIYSKPADAGAGVRHETVTEAFSRHRPDGPVVAWCEPAQHSQCHHCR
ncbi:hypothetical protein D3C85_694040 [compost metagenome]